MYNHDAFDLDVKVTALDARTTEGGLASIPGGLTPTLTVSLSTCPPPTVLVGCLVTTTVACKS